MTILLSVIGVWWFAAAPVGCVLFWAAVRYGRDDMWRQLEWKAELGLK